MATLDVDTEADVRTHLGCVWMQRLVDLGLLINLEVGLGKHLCKTAVSHWVELGLGRVLASLVCRIIRTRNVTAQFQVVSLPGRCCQFGYTSEQSRLNVGTGHHANTAGSVFRGVGRRQLHMHATCLKAQLQKQRPNVIPGVAVEGQQWLQNKARKNWA